MDKFEKSDIVQCQEHVLQSLENLGLMCKVIEMGREIINKQEVIHKHWVYLGIDKALVVITGLFNYL